MKYNKNVKKHYAIIPVVIAIIAVSIYSFYPHENTFSTSSQTFTESQSTQQQSNSHNTLSSQTLIENGSPVLGNPNAKITIVEWGDYQCTYCHLFQQNTQDELIQEYVNTGKANFVFRDFPLNGPDSVLAAEASYCADDQNKYWQYHNELYNNWGGERTGWINQKSLDQFATNVGLDLNQFDKCMSDKKYESKVLENQQFGQEIGINGTPSFIIFNDKTITKVVGAQPFSVFKQVLDNI
jgi:protein-disulfide isomerase